MRCGCLDHGTPLILTPDLCTLAMHVGIERQIWHWGKKTKNHVHKEPPKVEGILYHIQGAGGEIAAGKILGIPPILSVDFNQRKCGDLEDGTEVRTRPEVYNDLPIREQDPEDRRYVLMVGRLPVYWYVGGIWGKDARREEWWHEYRNVSPAWWVPHQALWKESDNGW